MRVWFNKYSQAEINQYDVQYEYSSAMHYGITVSILSFIMFVYVMIIFWVSNSIKQNTVKCVEKIVVELQLSYNFFWIRTTVGILLAFMLIYILQWFYSYISYPHWKAFSKDGKSQTIKAKDHTKEESIGKVWRKELAFSDVKGVNRMYECSGE